MAVGQSQSAGVSAVRFDRLSERALAASAGFDKLSAVRFDKLSERALAEPAGFDKLSAVRFDKLSERVLAEPVEASMKNPQTYP